MKASIEITSDATGRELNAFNAGQRVVHWRQNIVRGKWQVAEGFEESEYNQPSLLELRRAVGAIVSAWDEQALMPVRGSK